MQLQQPCFRGRQRVHEHFALAQAQNLHRAYASLQRQHGEEMLEPPRAEVRFGMPITYNSLHLYFCFMIFSNKHSHRSPWPPLCDMQTKR